MTTKIEFGVSVVGSQDALPTGALSNGCNQMIRLFSDNLGEVNGQVQSSLRERINTRLNKVDLFLDEFIPNNGIQIRLDHVGEQVENFALYIKTKFSSLIKFNDWLDDNGQGKFYLKLATFIAKLPLRVARNIVCLIYQIIKTATTATFYTVTHPLKALNKLAKLLMNIVFELAKPEMWSQIGIGLVGGGLGHSLITGNPFSVIIMAVGAGLSAFGLTAAVVKIALKGEKEARWEAIKEKISEQTAKMIDTFFTAFCIGIMVGSIQNSIKKTLSSDKISQEKVTNNDSNLKQNHSSQALSNQEQNRLKLERFLQEISARAVDPYKYIEILGTDEGGTYASGIDAIGNAHVLYMAKDSTSWMVLQPYPYGGSGYP